MSSEAMGRGSVAMAMLLAPILDVLAQGLRIKEKVPTIQLLANLRCVNTNKSSQYWNENLLGSSL